MVRYRPFLSPLLIPYGLLTCVLLPFSCLSGRLNILDDTYEARGGDLYEPGGFL